ncbi:phosphotransferase enzyme family protein, partial [Metarhizium majus ARSEF 297]
MSGFDEIAEKAGDAQWDKWKDKILGARSEIALFVACRLGRDAGEVIDWFGGSFNFCLQVMFNDAGADAVIRFPKPGHTTFRDEKVTNEVQIIKFLHEQTNIPVPRLWSWGLTKDSLYHFGPFIISEFIEGVHLSGILKDPAVPAKIYLNPNIDSRILDVVLEQISDILLQLFQFDFSRIGAVSKDPTLDTWSVTRRPLTYSMNELATTAFYPLDKFATDPFESASGYFRHLSDENLTHLFTQRNLSSTATEAEEQYLARHLFTRLVTKHCIDDNGPFQLFCDDLGPQNILVDPKSLRITVC